MNFKKRIILASTKLPALGFTPIGIKAMADGKTVELNIDCEIGSFDYTWGSDGPVITCDATKEAIKAELKAIASVKGDIIIVNINSPGGDINHGLSIHDLLAQNPAKKIARINGMTASAATIVAMACDEIQMSENSLFLPHKSSTWASGNANDLAASLDDLNKVDAVMAKIYSKKTGKTVEQVMAQMNVNNGYGEWMTADEAESFGFITSKFEPKQIAAFFDADKIKALRLPAIPTDKIKSQKTNTMEEKSIVAAVIAGIKALLPGKDADKTIDAQITTAAETAANDLKKTFDASIVTATAAVKTGIEAANKLVVDAKDAEIVALKADKQTAIEATAAVQAALDIANGKETGAADKKDPNLKPDGKKKLSGMDKVYAASAAALRGETHQADEDEEDEE